MTTATIQGEQFFINGEPTYQDRTFSESKIEGPLLNSAQDERLADETTRRKLTRAAAQPSSATLPPLAPSPLHQGAAAPACA